MAHNTPEKPAEAFRIALELDHAESRMDNILLEALRNQNENGALKNISRSGLKTLFNESKIQIKGQRCRSSSALAKGTTYVDILGYEGK